MDDHLESKIDWNIGLVLGKTEAAWEKDSKELKIEQQKFGLRSACYFAKGLESLFNGMYFYSGSMILVTYSPGAFALMASISAGFLLSNLIAKIYEEYTFQNKLIITVLAVQEAP